MLPALVAINLIALQPVQSNALAATTAPTNKTTQSTIPANRVERAKAELAEAKAAYNAAKVAFQKNPATKDQYITAAYAYGEITVLSPVLVPKEKYPEALRVFREITKLDPGHAEAQGWIDQIVSIYESMGLPVPGESTAKTS